MAVGEPPPSTRSERAEILPNLATDNVLAKVSRELPIEMGVFTILRSPVQARTALVPNYNFPPRNIACRSVRPRLEIICRLVREQS